MRKQEKILKSCEKLVKAAKRTPSVNKPVSCARCVYYRPDFKYRRCQYSRCPFGMCNDVFRKKPLKRDKFSGNEVVNMNG